MVSPSTASVMCLPIGRIQLQRLSECFVIPSSPAAAARSILSAASRKQTLAQAERLPVVRELGETSLNVLVHPTITPEQMAAYAEAVRPVVKRACR